jgi:hypothetical protein
MGFCSSIGSIMKSISALGLGALSTTAHAQDNGSDAGAWLAPFTPKTQQERFELSVPLAGKGVWTTQQKAEVLRKLRPAYAHDPVGLIAASQVIAIDFQAVAAANDCWRSE